LTEGTSLTYFSGIHWGGGERLFAMVLPAKGNAFYVCPAFEEARAREQIAKAPSADQADVRIWQEMKVHTSGLRKDSRIAASVAAPSVWKKPCASFSAKVLEKLRHR